MPTLNTSGSQTATLGTEHTLATVTLPGKFTLMVDAANLAGTEELELRIYGKARSSDTERLQYYTKVIGPQTLILLEAPAVPSPHHYKVTLEQTNGTGRAFPWAIYDDDNGDTGIVVEDSQTAVLTTEHTLATITDEGNYVLAVDTANLTGSEQLELRLYGKARSTDTERLMYYASFTGTQTLILKVSEEIGSVHHFKATLEQTGGTGRAFPWAIYDVDGADLKMSYKFVDAADLTAATLVGPSITFTRASVGKHWDSSAVLQEVSTDVARLDHDPRNSDVSRGLLVEEARTNIALQSEDFSTTWSGGAGETTDDRNAPDGNATADKITRGAGAGNYNKTQGSIAVTSGTAYTASLFVRAAEVTWMAIEFVSQFPGNSHCYFDVGGGVLGSKGAGATSASIESVGDSWYRVTLISTANATGNTSFRCWLAEGNNDVNFPSGSATDGMHYWGAQYEAGDWQSTYIATTTASVTRAADVPTVTDLSDINASAGTIVVFGSFPYADGAVNALFTIDDGGTTDRIYLERDAAENINFATTHSADTDGASDGAAVIALDTTFKVAAAYADDDVIAYVDGVSSGADSSAAFPLADTLTAIRFGADSGGNYWNGHIDTIRYFDVRKTNSFLDTVTT